MHEKVGAGEGFWFMSMMVSAAAMDSENPVIPGSICLLSALALLQISRKKGPLQQAQRLKGNKYPVLIIARKEGGLIKKGVFGWAMKPAPAAGPTWAPEKNAAARTQKAQKTRPEERNRDSLRNLLLHTIRREKLMNEFKISVELKGIGELVAAINRLAGHAGTPAGMLPAGSVQPTAGQAVPGTVPLAAPVQGQAPQAAPAQMPSIPMQGQMPPQVPQAPAQIPPAPMQQTVPTSTPVQGYTLEQLQVAAAGLMSANKGQQVMAILQRFGIQAMTELPKERYGEFAMAIREAGAQI